MTRSNRKGLRGANAHVHVHAARVKEGLGADKARLAGTRPPAPPGCRSIGDRMRTHHATTRPCAPRSSLPCKQRRPGPATPTARTCAPTVLRPSKRPKVSRERRPSPTSPAQPLPPVRVHIELQLHLPTLGVQRRGLRERRRAQRGRPERSRARHARTVGHQNAGPDRPGFSNKHPPCMHARRHAHMHARAHAHQ